MTPQTLSSRIDSQHTKPLVSIICATYNQKPFISKCLDSIINQVTDFPAELILHDDASTDGTTEIVHDYANRFPNLIKLLTQTKNQYAETNKLRIKLLEHARGDYVALCDGDDFWCDPLKLMKQQRFLEGHPEFVLCYHPAMIVNEMDNVLVAQTRSEKNNRNYTAEELRVFACGWIALASVMHRNVPIDHPPEFHLAPNSDNFLPVLLAKFGGAGFQKDILPSAVRHHRNTAFSSQTDAKKTSMHLRSHLQIVSYLLRQGENEHARRLISTWLVNYLNRYLKIDH